MPSVVQNSKHTNKQGCPMCAIRIYRDYFRKVMVSMGRIKTKFTYPLFKTFDLGFRCLNSVSALICASIVISFFNLPSVGHISRHSGLMLEVLLHWNRSTLVGFESHLPEREEGVFDNWIGRILYHDAYRCVLFDLQCLRPTRFSLNKGRLQ